MSDTYVLTVIDEVETPLAATMGSTSLFPTFIFTVIIAVLVAAGLVLGFYMARCLRLRQRYTELCLRTGVTEDKSAYWDARRLKDEITGMELSSAGDLLKQTIQKTAG